MRQHEILIVGAGIAGLSCAIRLHQHGGRAQLFDKLVTGSAPGVGFLLMDNGLAIMDKLGLGEAVRALGQSSWRATRLDACGRVLTDKPVTEHLCLRRSDLLALLRQKVPPDWIREGARCLDIQQSATRCKIVLENGQEHVGDLIVGADGIGSRVRRAAFPQARLRQPRVKELLAIAPAPALARKLNRRLLKIGCPNGGLAVGMTALSSAEVLWYIQFAGGAVDIPNDDPPLCRQIARDLVGHFPRPVPELIEHTDFSSCFLAGTTDLEPLPALVRDRVALVGDAAHTMVTLTSQGANTALEDGQVLADCLLENRLADALATYNAKRHAVTRMHVVDGRALESAFLAANSCDSPAPLLASDACWIEDTDMFADDKVNLDILRQRAYNHRWAALPEDVIALTAADPDFSGPAVVAEAIKAYVDAGPLSYGPAEGLPEFRECCARVCRERYGHRDVTPARILATDSVASGMYVVARWALQPGDEAIVFDPVDYLFHRSVEAAGGVPVMVRIDPATGVFDIEAMRTAISPRTRMIGICNPHNPLGRVMERETLLAIGRLAVEHNLILLSDEIWCDIVFPPHQHVATASLPEEIAARTVSLYGYSKAFGLAGLRVGYIVAPDDASCQGLFSASHAGSTAYGCSTLSQIAAKAAYDEGWPWVQAFVGHLNTLRDFAVQRLNAMDGVTCRSPEGTYLLFPDISAFGRPSIEIWQHLLERARVAVVPGTADFFGPGAEGHLRIAFPTSRAILSEGLDRLEQGLRTL